jgi:hypothetical protein
LHNKAVGVCQADEVCCGLINDSLTTTMIGRCFSPGGRVIAFGGGKQFAAFSVETGELLAVREHPTGNSDRQIHDELARIEFSGMVQAV